MMWLLSRRLPADDQTGSLPRMHVEGVRSSWEVGAQPAGLLAAVVRASSDAIVCLDHEQRIVEFNRGAERVFLRSRAEVLGQKLALLLPEAIRGVHGAHVHDYAEHGEPRRMTPDRIIVRGIRSTGEEFAAAATIARHELEGQVWLSVIIRDLDDQAHVESAAEHRWRELFEAAGEGILIADLDGRCTDANAAGCELLGYRRDELIGKAISDLVATEQAARLEESRRRLATGDVVLAEWRLRRKDGAEVPVEISAKLLSDGRWVGFVRDIRHRKAAEEALHLDQQRLRVAMAGSPISAFSQDRMLRYTWSFNPPAPLWPSDIVGKAQTEMDALDLAHLVEVKRRVIETGVPARELIRNVIGGRERYFDTRIEPLRDELGQIIGVTGAAWDVTDRKRAEDEQRLLADVSGALEAAALDWTQLPAIASGVVVGRFADACITELVDGTGPLSRHAVHADPAKAEVCKALGALVLDRDRPYIGAEAARSHEPVLVEQVSPEYLASVAQSDRCLELLRGLSLRSLIVMPLVSRGRLLGTCALGSSSRVFDIEDLRTATELVRRVAAAVDRAWLHQELQRASEARAEVLAIVAHDLRNPLNSILLQSELLESALKERVERALAGIRGSADRMNRLIEDLLDVVRREAGEPLAVDLSRVMPAEVAEETVGLLRPVAASSSIELVVRYGAGLPAVQADRHRLVQLLDNLLSNAIKFSSAGQRVVLAVERHEGEVRFSVADTGRGIRPDQIEHLFDRFWQADRRDRRGLGLGLAVVKGIVEAHHGRIWVESEVGRGSTFHVAIPVAAATPAEPPRDG